MRIRLVLPLLLVFAGAVQANDYPTFDRVEYVLRCMNENGGQNYDNLYHCVCMVDQIAQRVRYADFAEAETFRQLRSTPGERGSLFRDPPRVDELRETMEKATEEATAACFAGKKG